MKRRLLAFLLAFVMTFSLVPVNVLAAGEVSSADTVSGDAEQTEPAYTADLVKTDGESDNLAVEDVFSFDYTFSAKETAEVESFWGIFQFNPETTEFFWLQDPGLEVETTEEGILRIGGGKGTLEASDYAFNVQFQAKALGDATVTLKSFEVNGTNYLSAPVSVTRTVGCNVTWAENAAYTVTGEKLVAAGSDYTFTVAANEGYDATNAVVKVNGEEVTGTDGKYTVESVSSDLAITVEGVTEEVKYAVTIPEDAAYTVTGEKTVRGGGDYSFTVKANDGYNTTDMVVKVNGTKVTAADGVYTVKNVSKDLVITVTGVKKNVVNGLSALRFGSTSSRTATTEYKLSPTFAPTVKEYTLYVPDSNAAVYIWATRDTNSTTKAKTVAAWTKVGTDKSTSVTVTSGSSWGSGMSGLVSAGETGNTLTVTVTDGDFKDEYTVKIVRTDPTLTKLSLDGVKINETFSASGKTYTAKTTKDSVTVQATPRGESYTVTYNGGTENTIPLEMGVNKIEIVVTNTNGDTNTYTLTVTRAEHSVTIPTSESYLVTGEEAAVDGADYTFKVGVDYRYEATDDFAVKVNGEVVTGENGTYTVKNVTTDLVITVEGVTKKILKPVTVYFSFSHDDKFEFCDNSGQTMALKEVTVPYFDLELYGLEDFYFASEDYGAADPDNPMGGSALSPGTKEFAYGKITMFHLFIYATEVYYLGVDPADAGKGYLRDNGLGTEIFNVTGSTGSTFLYKIWNYDLNLNYYLNNEYPLASEGWGATSDQILLHDGDVVTLGHFTDWSFYGDTNAVFNHIETDITDPVQGDKVTMKIYRDGADMSGSYGTAHTLRTNCPDVYCTLASNVTTGDVTKWTKVGTADGDGTLVVDTSSLAPGEYIFAIPGQYGNEYPDSIVGAPGGIRLTIHEKPVVKGDINGDGVIDVTDVMALFNAISSGDALEIAVADYNGDGVVDTFDVMALYNAIKSGE